MNKDVIEANVIIANCNVSKRPFGIRIEKRKNNIWYTNWAFKISEKSVAREGYDNTTISGKIESDIEYPGCPFCGANYWFSCGRCGKLTCWNGSDEIVTCVSCGNSGSVKIKENFDLKGSNY